MTTQGKPRGLQELETITVLAVFLLLITVFSQRWVLVYSALALLLTGLFLRPVSGVISQVWLKFAEVIGSFNSKVILAAVFFIVITPLAFLFRLISKNPLQLKNDLNLNSLYIERNHLYTKSDFEKMW